MMAETAMSRKEEEPNKKTVLVVGLDDSEHSFYALEWTLSHFFSAASGGASVAPFKLVVVHSKPAPSSVVNLAHPGAAEMVPVVDSDLRKTAANVVEKAKELCVAHSVSAIAEVVDGDARNVLCDAVEKHHADMLIVGNHGYGAIKRAFLGSVSDYCSHHANCSVMIVKKPKRRH
ncbi:universal stress protein PHOS34 [Canna indica]|uniref:Universal stress protein PHOS34 n=1 Tax=Canna indica TaxID=4628 RepID=A0AAQ3KHT5_9LILI|nr:universal stress protein PHOS34 [Canna indica]